MPKRIETGSPDGDAIDFSEDMFSGWVELCEDYRLYLYYIISRHKNQKNTQHLLGRWLHDNYDIRIVKPSPIMQHIIKKFGFEPAYEYLPAHYDDEIEVWRQIKSFSV
jgi:hypothetical protein